MKWSIPQDRGMVWRLAWLLLVSLLVTQVVGVVMVWYARTEIPSIMRDVLIGRVVADYERVLNSEHTVPSGLGPDIRPGGWRFAVIDDWHEWAKAHEKWACCTREDRPLGIVLTRHLSDEIGVAKLPAYHVMLARRSLLENEETDGAFWVHVGVALPDGRWLVSQQGPLQRDPWRGTEQLVGFSLLTAAVPQLLLLVLLVRSYSRSLRRLVHAADHVSHGEPMPPLPMTGPRELREITAAFNLMQQRQTDFVSDRTRMLAGIGHDLRTPLTALRLRAELVEDEETRVSMVNNISRMMQLVEETMRFAREDAARAAPFVETDLINLANTLIHEQRELGRDVNWAASKPVGPCLYRCQPVLVRRALVNVVENAFTYGQRARISLQCSAEFLRFIVEDDGPGMSRELLEKATQPFLRGGAQASGGVGLGLAIARSCVKAHGGRLSLSNRPEGGLRVEIALPN